MSYTDSVVSIAKDLFAWLDEQSDMSEADKQKKVMTFMYQIKQLLNIKEMY